MSLARQLEYTIKGQKSEERKQKAESRGQFHDDALYRWMKNTVFLASRLSSEFLGLLSDLRPLTSDF